MTPEALEEAVISDVAKVMPHAALMACNPDDLAAIARAALAVVREKMREPTPEMLSIGGAGAEGLKRKLWYAMIAASPLGGDKP